MRILSLDYEPFFGSDNVLASFSSDTSAFDFDAVIWDPEGSFRKYSEYAERYMGLPSLDDYNSSSLKADTKRRRTEFKEFLEAGRILVVIARPPQSCYVTTGQVNYSGTGRNARKTTMVSAFDILAALPVSEPGFERASGNRIEVIGDGPLQAHIRQYKTDLAYSATMSSAPGTPIAKVTGTTRQLASSIRIKGGGLLVIIPDTTFMQDDEQKWPQKASQYQADLFAAIESLAGSSEVARPAWVVDYSTAQQREVRAAVTKQQATIESARAKLAGLQATAESVEIKDQLYLGTGRQLELRVSEVLAQMGGLVTEAEPGRDDWKVDFDGKPAVVEIKGVAKSAAEKHAAQLEKWVASGYEESSVMPKGILIVNTWRETPLVDRPEDDFPAQMLPYSEGRGHCLITGLEMFAISQDIDRDPARAKHWRDKIMSTSGRLKDVPSWRDFIDRATKEVAEEGEGTSSE